MRYESVVISSGHGLYVRGASGIIDEVDEARVVVDMLADRLCRRGIMCKTYHDDISHSQDDNLNRIVNYHNSCIRQLDISVHFNAFEPTHAGRGVEVLYLTQDVLAGKLSSAIAEAAQLIDRGPKYRSDLFFLSHTTAPAVLIEVCFVDSSTDCELYSDRLDHIVEAIADVLVPNSMTEPLPPETCIIGKVSQFGGPEDTGVTPDEGLAFIYEIDDAPHLFLPYQPENTAGLARRLNPFVHYFAMRFDYSQYPKETLLHHVGLIRNPKTGFALKAIPADWGPHESTNRIADLSPSLMDDLGLTTDDEAEIIFPYKG
jgi:N-acetylmuramoyl-L-alanine amidase